MVQIAQNSHDVVIFVFHRPQNMSALRGILSDAHSDSRTYFVDSELEFFVFAEQEGRSYVDIFVFFGEGRTMCQSVSFFGKSHNKCTDEERKKGDL